MEAQHLGGAVASEVRLHQALPDQERFDGLLLAVLPQERWRVCGSVLADGSIVSGDGTRRLAVVWWMMLRGESAEGTGQGLGGAAR